MPQSLHSKTWVCTLEGQSLPSQLCIAHVATVPLVDSGTLFADFDTSFVFVFTATFSDVVFIFYDAPMVLPEMVKRDLCLQA